MGTPYYVIEDWAGNTLYAHGTFKTFDDAWEYIHNEFPEEDWDDLYVEMRKEYD